jgi:glycosyltransferase involved in cell wall biosynthesis
MISVVVPVYKNSENIADLVAALKKLNQALHGDFEAVLVVDGSPDDSYLALCKQLPTAGFRSQLLELSRNFGSFAAMRAGLAAARGEYFCVMAADLQEPPELILQFHEKLTSGDYDVVVGQRAGRRQDPLMSRIFSRLFWGFYRRFVQPEIPEGGVDMFGCNAAVRDRIIELRENNSSLIGLLFWLGFRRCYVPYERRERKAGKSAWTFKKKLRYLNDSVFSFSDLPIRLLFRIGVIGLVWSAGFAVVIVILKLAGAVPVPGYAATVLTVSFFGALNCFGLGVIGNYVWRTFENTKFRPTHVVASHKTFDQISAAPRISVGDRAR